MMEGESSRFAILVIETWREPRGGERLIAEVSRVSMQIKCLQPSRGELRGVAMAVAVSPSLFIYREVLGRLAT